MQEEQEGISVAVQPAGALHRRVERGGRGHHRAEPAARRRVRHGQEHIRAGTDERRYSDKA